MTHACTLWQDRMLETECLSLDEQRALADHIAECDECARVFQEFVELRTMLTQFADAPVPDGFVDCVTDALRRERVRDTSSLNRMLLGLVFLLAAETVAAVWAPLGLGEFLQSVGGSVDNLSRMVHLTILSTAEDASHTVTAPFLALERLPPLSTIIQWVAMIATVLTIGFLAVLHTKRLEV